MEHLFFRSVLSIVRFERIRIVRVSLSITVRNEIVLRTSPFLLPLPLSCLCLFAKLFFAVGFANISSFFSIPRFFGYFFRSRFYTAYGLTRVCQFSIYTVLLREKKCTCCSNAIAQMCFYTFDYFLLCRLN